uniref:Uncharacterized protein n=1 Tax=Leersia perrieri TaxID=77586 RepID=A0A0D9Y1W1_9ORYZ
MPCRCFLTYSANCMSLDIVDEFHNSPQGESAGQKLPRHEATRAVDMTENLMPRLKRDMRGCLLRRHVNALHKAKETSR